MFLFFVARTVSYVLQSTFIYIYNYNLISILENCFYMTPEGGGRRGGDNICSHSEKEWILPSTLRPRYWLAFSYLISDSTRIKQNVYLQQTFFQAHLSTYSYQHPCVLVALEEINLSPSSLMWFKNWISNISSRVH